jgi:uroporphyrinogen-III synthase
LIERNFILYKKTDENMSSSKFLQNKTILITRSEEQSSELINKLTELGANVLSLPTIEIVPFESQNEIDEKIENLKNFDWLIFTSVNSVFYFIERIIQKISLDNLRECKICVVGEKTAESVQKYGLKISLIPEKFNSQGIISAFEKIEVKGLKFLFPSGDIAKEDIVEYLTNRGGEVERAIVYLTKLPEISSVDKIKQKFLENKIDIVIFMSPSSFNNFLKIIPEENIHNLLGKSVKISAIGPTTAKAIKERGFEVNIIPTKSTIEGLIEEMV